MPPTTDLRQAASGFARRLKAEFPEDITKIVLYGSVARGDPGPESDVDLIVVTRDKRNVERRLSGILGQWMMETGRIVQVIVVNVDEYETMRQRGSAFAHAIRDEGITLEQ